MCVHTAAGVRSRVNLAALSPRRRQALRTQKPCCAWSHPVHVSALGARTCRLSVGSADTIQWASFHQGWGAVRPLSPTEMQGKVTTKLTLTASVSRN